MFTLPDFPSPVASGWITGPWNFLPGFTPHGAVLRDACRERGRALSTHPDYPVIHPSIHLVHSKRCDLVVAAAESDVWRSCGPAPLRVDTTLFCPT
jgi:hypothetical protein